MVEGVELLWIGPNQVIGVSLGRFGKEVEEKGQADSAPLEDSSTSPKELCR
jgi:hypothetical protein